MKLKFNTKLIQFQIVDEMKKKKKRFVTIKSNSHENYRFFFTAFKAQQAIKRLFKLEKNNSLHSSFYIFNNAL